jgi:hypothetical protein
MRRNRSFAKGISQTHKGPRYQQKILSWKPILVRNKFFRKQTNKKLRDIWTDLPSKWRASSGTRAPSPPPSCEANGLDVEEGGWTRSDLRLPSFVREPEDPGPAQDGGRNLHDLCAISAPNSTKPLRTLLFDAFKKEGVCNLEKKIQHEKSSDRVSRTAPRTNHRVEDINKGTHPLQEHHAWILLTDLVFNDLGTWIKRMENLRVVTPAHIRAEVERRMAIQTLWLASNTRIFNISSRFACIWCIFGIKQLFIHTRSSQVE